MPCIIALDFETTGLLVPNIDDPFMQPGIVEIGAVKVIVGSDLSYKDAADEFEKLLDPEHHYEEKAQEISGIKKEETIGKPNFKEVFFDFADFFVGVDILVTYNGLRFDLPLLMFNLRKYGLEYNFPWPPQHIDLMVVATPIMNMQGKSGTKPPKLIELFRHLFDAEFEGQHRALDDARATMQCALKLRGKGYLWV